MPNIDIYQRVRDRVNDLPDDVWTCPDCGADEVKIRRSSLRPNPCADDVTLKCMACYRTKAHGIPVERSVYTEELDARREVVGDGPRVLDFVADGPADEVEQNLADLGYLDY